MHGCAQTVAIVYGKRRNVSTSDVFPIMTQSRSNQGFRLSKSTKFTTCFGAFIHFSFHLTK